MLHACSYALSVLFCFCGVYMNFSTHAHTHKRLAQFRFLQHQLAPEAPQLKPLCPTRWTVRTGAIDSVIKNYDVIRQEMEQISDGTCGETSSRALGLLSLMDKFALFFGLKISLCSVQVNGYHCHYKAMTLLHSRL